jgi:type VI secretion system protein ImpH
MAGDAGKPTATVADHLQEHAPQFTFLQAMWLLHRSYPGAVPVGQEGPPSEELVRLRPSASLAFPPSDLESLQQRDTRPPFRLTTTFMGLYGTHSPLPSFYSEEILRRCSDNEEHTLRAFIDLFNHRLISLLYRGVLKYRGQLLWQRGARDEFSWRLFALSGLATESAVASTGLDSQRLLRYAGTLSHRPRSASAIASVLSTWFGALPVTLRQCVARWVYLSDDMRSTLGRHGCRLGDDATIGRRVRDFSGKYRICIGAVDFDTYLTFLPGSDNLRTVHDLTRTVAGEILEHDVEITVRAEDTPRFGVALNRHAYLGWTTGLYSRPGGRLSVVFS